MINSDINSEENLEPEDLLKQGWIYHDFPGKFSFEIWDFLLTIIGEGNYKLLVYSEGNDWKRGQFLLSPQAQKNLKAYAQRGTKQ